MTGVRYGTTRFGELRTHQEVQVKVVRVRGEVLTLYETVVSTCCVTKGATGTLQIPRHARYGHVTILLLLCAYFLNSIA